MTDGDIIVTSNDNAFISAKEGKKIYQGQEEGFLLDPSDHSIRRYKGKTYVKKDGSITQYYT